MAHDLVVAGAGVIGCAIARELAMRGAGCTVLDPRPVAGGATQASAGMLAPYVEAHGGPLLALGTRSLGMYPAWIGGLRNEGEEVEFALIGTLQIALTADRAAQLRRGTRGRWIEPPDVARAFPFLCSTAGAFSTGEHGYVDAPQLARALARSAERHGATFRTARVERIEPHGDGLRVRIDGDVIVARRVILAAGAWTNLI